MFWDASIRRKSIELPFLLQGEADQWWKTIRWTCESTGEEITWSLFKNKFDEKFNPAHVRDQKLAECEALTQGNLTVLQYKSIKLSRYAEDLIMKQKDNIRP